MKLCHPPALRLNEGDLFLKELKRSQKDSYTYCEAITSLSAEAVNTGKKYLKRYLESYFAYSKKVVERERLFSKPLA
jgi:hypothetical protein